MELLGQPLIIQNTAEHGWVVTWTDAVRHWSGDELVETVSFTVALPRRADLTIAELQTFAMKRAAELLQVAIRDREQAAQ